MTTEKKSCIIMSAIETCTNCTFVFGQLCLYAIGNETLIFPLLIGRFGLPSLNCAFIGMKDRFNRTLKIHFDYYRKFLLIDVLFLNTLTEIRVIIPGPEL